MKFLLDTNICAYLIRKRPPEVLAKFATSEPGDLGISAITRFELLFGAENSSAPEKNFRLLGDFFLPLEIVEFDSGSAVESAKIRFELKRSPIGPMDLLIAGQARSLGITLVTNNIREFARIKDLKLENWVLRKVK